MTTSFNLLRWLAAALLGAAALFAAPAQAQTLKVGDKVVTTGGLFGSIARISDQIVQLQVAPNVRVDISKAAIVGYQGQAPVVEAPNT